MRMHIKALISSIIAVLTLTDASNIPVGYYENHQYGAGGKNPWHYVTLSETYNHDAYTWRNDAGVTWTMYRDTVDTLRVGSNCPYYKTGYRSAKFTRKSISGPHNEKYTLRDCVDRSSSCNESICRDYQRKGECAFSCGLCTGVYMQLPVGYYVSRDNLKNDSSYVVISKNPDMKSYTWKDLAGTKWTLLPYNNSFLRVGEDCPYKQSGYTFARYYQGKIHGPRSQRFHLESCRDKRSSCPKSICTDSERKRECALSCRICADYAVLPPYDSQRAHKSETYGAGFGGFFGGVAFAFLLSIVVWWLRKLQKKTRKTRETQTALTDEENNKVGAYTNLTSMECETNHYTKLTSAEITESNQYEIPITSSGYEISMPSCYATDQAPSNQHSEEECTESYLEKSYHDKAQNQNALLRTIVRDISI